MRKSGVGCSRARPALICVTFLVAIVAVRAASAADYYVSTGGKDAAAGTAAQPWASIRHALGHLQAGDTLHVLAGDYSESNVVSGLRGTAEAPITIAGTGSPRIRATGRDVFLIWNGCGYLTLEGLELAGGRRAGAIVNGSSHITFRDCVIHHNGRWGVQTLLSDHVTVEGCHIYASASQHGIYFSTTDYPTARGNVIHDCAGCGIHMNGDQSEGGDGMITGATIVGNTIYNCGSRGGAAINMDSVEDSLVADNLLYHNLAGGIAAFRQDGRAAGERNRFYFNTVCFEPGRGRYALQLHSGSKNADIKDNILVCGDWALDISSAALEGLQCDYNVFVRYDSETPISIRAVSPAGVGIDTPHSLAAWQAATGHDAHSLAAMPRFVDPAGGDYHLTPASPGADAGVAVPAVKVDLAGTARPQGAGVDIGALESAPPASAPAGRAASLP